MKKRFAVIVLALALVLSLTACGGKTDSKTITVGATPAPHAQILEICKEILAEEGYTLVIREFDDYVLPNEAHHEVNVSSNISDNITGLTFSGNLGVLKTKSGYASAISVPIDNLDCPAILGTIAGDNTILLILREDARRSQVIEALQKIFPMLNNVL